MLDTSMKSSSVCSVHLPFYHQMSQIHFLLPVLLNLANVCMGLFLSWRALLAMDNMHRLATATNMVLGRWNLA